MKKIGNKIIFLLLLLAITAISCKKFLELKPTSVLSTGNAYNSAKDLENALVGAYNIFYQEYYIWDNVLLEDVRSDNAYVGGGGDPGIVPYDLVNIAPGNDRMYADWSQLYTGIARCNLILDKVDNVTDPEFANRKKQIIGEASFLRAFHYFQLVKTFGGVPIELHSNSADPEKTRLPRSSEKEVYDQIVKDLETALADLPDAFEDGNPGVNKVKATKGAANALLAKVWAQRSDRDYNKVLQYCNAVINSPAGYQLLSNYADLFDGNHYENVESILEIPFIAGTDLGNWGPQMFLAPEDGWQKYCVPSKDLVSDYQGENDEVRLNSNIIFMTDVPWADENWNPCQVGNVGIPFNNKQKHPNDWASGDHYYLLRLADIILLKAEALNELGNIDESATALNQIRERVHLKAIDPVSKEQMRDKILNERRLELAFEAQRWDDLVRLKVATTVMNSVNEVKYTCNNGTPSTPIKIQYNVNDQKWLAPIPQLEIDANPNLVQNPGY
jgi:starch-binding outer membrane protein, SusD/RagB family